MHSRLFDLRRGRQLQTLGSGILRYGLTFLLLLFGTFKFFRFEAEAIQPLLTHSPFLAWLPAALGIQGSSALIGVWWRWPLVWGSPWGRGGPGSAPSPG